MLPNLLPCPRGAERQVSYDEICHPAMSLPHRAPLPRTPDRHRANLRRRRADIYSVFNNLFGLAISATEEWEKAKREGKVVADELAMTKPCSSPQYRR